MPGGTYSLSLKQVLITKVIRTKKIAIDSVIIFVVMLFLALNISVASAFLFPGWIETELSFFNRS